MNSRLTYLKGGQDLGINKVTNSLTFVPLCDFFFSCVRSSVNPRRTKWGTLGLPRYGFLGFLVTYVTKNIVIFCMFHVLRYLVLCFVEFWLRQLNRKWRLIGLGDVRSPTLYVYGTKNTVRSSVGRVSNCY